MVETDRGFEAEDPEQYVAIFEMGDEPFMYDYCKGFTLTKVDAEAVLPPEGLDADQWLISYSGSWGQAYMEMGNIVRNGADIWLQGLDGVKPAAWLKGTIDGNKITVPSGQYLGEGQEVLFFTGARIIGQTEDGYDKFQSCDNVTLTMEADRIALDEDCVISEEFIDGTLVDWFIRGLSLDLYQGDTPMTPPTPENLFVSLVFDRYGYDVFYFDIIPSSEQGEYINPDKLYYEAFLNSELMVFEPSMYEGLPEAISLIPFNVSYGPSLNYNTDGNGRLFNVYDNSWETLGIRTVYIVDGVRNESPIATIDREGNVTVAIKSAMADMTVENREYYNLAGLKVAEPTCGIYIVKDTLSDGSIRTRKLVVRK